MSLGEGFGWEAGRESGLESVTEIQGGVDHVMLYDKNDDGTYALLVGATVVRVDDEEEPNMAPAHMLMIPVDSESMSHLDSLDVAQAIARGIARLPRKEEASTPTPTREARSWGWLGPLRNLLRGKTF